MRITENNYKTAGAYFSQSKAMTCPRCQSVFLVEGPNDVSRKIEKQGDQRETYDVYVFYVKCPCCKREDVELKNLPQVVRDLVDDRYKNSAPDSYYL